MNKLIFVGTHSHTHKNLFLPLYLRMPTSILRIICTNPLSGMCVSVPVESVFFLSASQFPVFSSFNSKCVCIHRATHSYMRVQSCKWKIVCVCFSLFSLHFFPSPFLRITDANIQTYKNGFCVFLQVEFPVDSYTNTLAHSLTRAHTERKRLKCMLYLFVFYVFLYVECKYT